MAVELELIEGGRLLQQPGNGGRCEFLLEKRHRLAERQIEESWIKRIKSPPRPQPWQ
jgi:hypothetical protein